MPMQHRTLASRPRVVDAWTIPDPITPDTINDLADLAATYPDLGYRITTLRPPGSTEPPAIAIDILHDPTHDSRPPWYTSLTYLHDDWLDVTGHSTITLDPTTTQPEPHPQGRGSADVRGEGAVDRCGREVSLAGAPLGCGLPAGHGGGCSAALMRATERAADPGRRGVGR